jgi:hypothetical protein
MIQAGTRIDLFKINIINMKGCKAMFRINEIPQPVVMIRPFR